MCCAFSMRNSLLSFFILLFLLSATTTDSHAQSLEASISVISTSPARVKVEGERRAASRIWSFRNAYASLMGLGERIENLTLTDANGINVPARKIASGEYEAAGAATRWSYEVKLDVPLMTTDAAYASWIAGERGFLMLGDLLPSVADEKQATGKSARVKINAPANWKTFSNEKKRSDGQFEIADAEDAVFFIGSDLREWRERVGPMDFTFVTGGNWAFTDEVVLWMSVSILKDFRTRIGNTTRQRAMLMLAPFPRSISAERWSAETRGGTVILLSGQSPSKIAGATQLSTPLTHELFHLWVPNGLALDGNYDWFYEGFTVYQAMYTAVRLQYLTVQEYLNALGRAYDAYLSSSERQSLSLLSASQRRWTGANGLVYQKGMLVAFLYDLTLKQASSGKRSLDDVYRDLFRRAEKSGRRKDGNEVVLSALKGQSNMQEFARRYIEGTDELDLPSLIKPFGLRVERAGARTQISVMR